MCYACTHSIRTAYAQYTHSTHTVHAQYTHSIRTVHACSHTCLPLHDTVPQRSLHTIQCSYIGQLFRSQIASSDVHASVLVGTLNSSIHYNIVHQLRLKRTHTHARTHAHTHTHVRAYTHKHMHARTHTHTHTHTHTNARAHKHAR